MHTYLLRIFGVGRAVRGVECASAGSLKCQNWVGWVTRVFLTRLLAAVIKGLAARVVERVALTKLLHISYVLRAAALLDAARAGDPVVAPLTRPKCVYYDRPVREHQQARRDAQPTLQEPDVPRWGVVLENAGGERAHPRGEDVENEADAALWEWQDLRATDEQARYTVLAGYS